MKIIYCDATCETGERAEEIFLETLPDYALNLGVSNYSHENDLIKQGFKIINKTDAIKNCVNKKRMFEKLVGKVETLEYYDLKKPSHLFKALIRLIQNKEIVVRKKWSETEPRRINSLFKFVRQYKKYDYATLYEDKRLEWRALVFRNKLFKLMLKNAVEENTELSSWQLKQINCDFDEIKNPGNKKLIAECEKAAEILGIDLCGIDVCLTNDLKLKIIEVNSGMAMGYGTLERLKKLIEKEAE